MFPHVHIINLVISILPRFVFHMFILYHLKFKKEIIWRHVNPWGDMFLWLNPTMMFLLKCYSHFWKHYKKSWLFRRPTWLKCSHWLKVWDMKKTCYIWPIHLIKVSFFTKCQVEILVKWTNVHWNGHDLVKLAILNAKGLVKLTILIWPLVKLTITISHLLKWAILIWWLSLLVKLRLPT